MLRAGAASLSNAPNHHAHCNVKEWAHNKTVEVQMQLRADCVRKCCWSQNEWLVRVQGLPQIGSKLEKLFFNKHPFARDGLLQACLSLICGRAALFQARAST